MEQKNNAMCQNNTVLVVLFVTVLIAMFYLFINDGSGQSVVTPFYIIKSEPMIKSNSSETMISKKNNSILETKNLSICVPHYDLLLKYLEDHRPKESYPNVDIKPLSAFQFPSYSVVTLRAMGFYGSKMFCRFFNADRKEIGQAQESVVIPDYIVHCCRRAGTKFMTLTRTATEETNDLMQMIERLDEVPPHFLGMCLGPIHEDEPKWLLLAELIEHYKLQGVTHFYLYIKDTDDYLNRLLFDYERTGEVSLIWLGYEKDRPGIEWHAAGIQECMIRSRMHSQYSIFADLDERIMPVNKTLAQYIKDTVASRKSTAAVIFRPRWLLREHLPPKIYEGEKTMKNELPTLVFHNTSRWPNSPSHTCKTVVDTSKIHWMWTHYPKIYLPGYDSYNVPPENGIVWHYRDLKADDWGVRWLKEVAAFGSFTNTSYPEPFLSEVYKQVKIRLDRVYPQNTTSNVVG